MEQQFDCKEPGCTEKVVYNDIFFIPASANNKSQERQEEVTYQTKTARLTCGKGHTYDYPVKVRADGKGGLVAY